MKKIAKVPFKSFEHIVEKYIANNEPVLIESPFEQKDFATWSPEELKRKIENKLVTICKRCDGKIMDVSDTERNVRMGLHDYIDTKINDPDYYLQQISVPDEFPELLEENQVEQLINPKLVTEVNLWIGGKKNVTPLHYDIGNNFFLQCHGQKRFVLFEPSQIDLLYPYSVGKSQYHNVSQVNIDDVNLEEFPLFEKSQPIEVTVKKGDILMLPATTWHQVSSENTSVSMNIWFKPFDFQMSLPTITRYFPQMFRTNDLFANLCNMVTPHKYTNYLDFCDHLLEKNACFEGLLASLAYVKNKVFALLLQDEPFAKSMKLENLNDMNDTEAQSHMNEVICTWLSSNDEVNQKCVAELSSAFKFCNDIIQEVSEDLDNSQSQYHYNNLKVFISKYQPILQQETLARSA
jgi:lysine-specific demethylase 8